MRTQNISTINQNIVAANTEQNRPVLVIWCIVLYYYCYYSYTDGRVSITYYYYLFIMIIIRHAVFENEPKRSEFHYSGYTVILV